MDSIYHFRDFIYYILEGPIAELSLTEEVELSCSGNVIYVTKDGKEYSLTIEEVKDESR